MKKIAASIQSVVAALALATCVSAQATVVFTESGTDSLVDGVRKAAADTHLFTIDTPGLYQASIVDLATLDDTGFSDPFSSLELAVKQLGPSGGFFGKAGLAPAPPSFTFSVDNPGSFAALVKAVTGCDGFGFYEIDITRIAAVPEAEMWLMLLAGVGLTWYAKIRKGRNSGSAAKARLAHRLAPTAMRA
ncbi:MAG TPA: hypothetical protein VMH26_04915 [Burkholderiales bacterium]|nr:hypothetical protein [Burkholderiales bacterium]